MQRARFYTQPKDQAVRNAPFVDNSYKWAGGGFLSSAEDLVRFGSAMLQRGFLKPESLRLLFTPQKTVDGKEIEIWNGMVHTQIEERTESFTSTREARWAVLGS